MRPIISHRSENFTMIMYAGVTFVKNYANVHPRGFLQSKKTEIPLQIMGLDLIGPNTTSLGHQRRYSLVIVDYFS